jgi:predicted SprT family Zn-dependent metalloprotease
VDTIEAAKLARDIMDEQGLTVWSFQYDGARKRFGQCSSATRTISLSRALVALNDRAEVEDTIRHEVAHATVGPGHGHDAAWQRECVRVGAKPTRCYSSDEVVAVARPWTFECSKGCKGR